MLKLMRYLKSVWWQLIIVLTLLTVQAYLQLELPTEMSAITKVVTSGARNLDGTLTAAGINEIWRVGWIMIAIAGGIALIAIVVSLLNSYIAANFGRRVRADIYKAVTNYSPTEFDKIGTASLITRTTNDVSQVQQVILMGIRIIVVSPVTLVVAVLKTLNANAQLALVLAIALPIVTIVVIVTFIFAAPLFEKIQREIDRVTLVFREGLTGVRVIRAFNQQKKEAKRFDDANSSMTDITIKVGRTVSFVSPIISIIMELTYLGIFFYAFAIMDGTPLSAVDGNAIGTTMAVAQYSQQIMMSFIMFAMIFIMVPRASASAKRINQVLELKPSVNDLKSSSQATSVKGQVEFKDVTFSFPQASAPTLQHINFIAKPGQITAIIGSTGSGKSTIINLIPRFYDATEGQVLVDNVDVREYTQHDLRDKIGFVPQQALLFTGSIKDNLRFGKADATEEQMWEATDVAQATHFINKNADKLDTVVSQGGKNFSGGQKQRLAIARALVKKPEIYIFDDAFSALDFKTDIKLRTALREYTKQSSVLIVAQRVTTIIDADNIIVLNESKIVGQGKHKDLLLSCDVYREIVFSQLDPDEINKTMLLGKQALTSEGGDQ
ncbi:MAG: ABC transporter ATP-binding protein [Firmicutes bacterium]|nr:ABC transporter ATP-binding protein [Bacillota bacterium]